MEASFSALLTGPVQVAEGVDDMLMGRLALRSMKGFRRIPSGREAVAEVLPPETVTAPDDFYLVFTFQNR